MTDATKRPPLRIGLTGGIASGKSVVAEFFAELGVPVIDTDVIARELVAPGQPALDEIRERFGDETIDADGNLDRAAMRRVVFADENARFDLEAILHPRIGAETRRQAAAAGGAYQLIVVPLLVGSPLLRFVDRVLAVDCDEETQIRRLMERDTETIEQARRILEAQVTGDERRAIADDVIDNNASIDSLRSRVRTLDRYYQFLAERQDRRESSPENS